MSRPVGRSAFTMLELVVVIAIMTILASMILVGAKALIGDANKKKSETIIQTVRQGIELAIANKGSAISPTEHPFAGSRADAGGQRFAFKRSKDGSDVSKTGMALKGVPDTSYLSSDVDKLLMKSDIYADDRIVMLYGARRESIGVLQSLRKTVTKYRQLPRPPKPADPTIKPKVLSPVTGAVAAYNDTNFPNTLVPTVIQDADTMPPYGLLGDSKLALDYLFGNSNAQAELASLKALFNADPSLPEDVNDYTTSVEERTVGPHREPLVFTNYGNAKNKDFKNVESKWKPGRIPVGTVSGGKTTLAGAGSDKWVRYRLPGMAVYDAWGNELLTVTGENNSYRVLSPGLDGAMAIDPGKNNKLDTNFTGDMDAKLPLTGDDKDGAKDNLE
jgi:prepilin-type N-terminal cleavage/methylation domain-containing protein